MAEKDLKELSLLEIAEAILKDEKKVSIYELIEKAATTKGIELSDVDALTQLYMDITLSAKFVYVGEGDKWALKDGNLEYWDKDGYAFIEPDQVSDEEFEDDEIEYTDFNLDEFESSEEEEADEEEEELDEEIIEEKEYVDVGLNLESTDEDDEVEDVDLDIDEDEYDEDDYNDIMDDYEDMYDK